MLVLQTINEGPSAQGDTTMLTNSNIALSIALVLATASAAIAAPRHAVRHQTATTVQQSPAGAYLSFASASRTNSANESAYIKIQDQGIRDGGRLLSFLAEKALRPAQW